MIDTSPEALAELKARPATIHRLFDGDFVVALIDALEEARAEIAALQSKIAYGPFTEMLPSPAIPPGDTGELKNEYDATKHVIGERARDWIERNRR
jgi:hypothetical protein